MGRIKELLSKYSEQSETEKMLRNRLSELYAERDKLQVQKNKGLKMCRDNIQRGQPIPKAWSDKISAYNNQIIKLNSVIDATWEQIKKE